MVPTVQQKMQPVLDLTAALDAHRQAGRIDAAAGVEQALENVLIGVILKELDRNKGEGLGELGYKLLKEDVEWLITNKK